MALSAAAAGKPMYNSSSTRSCITRNIHVTKPLSRHAIVTHALRTSSRCENAINQQIAQEYEASALYDMMHAYYDRAQVALPGFAHFFRKASDEEREHARALIGYMNRRGGRAKMTRTASAPFFEPACSDSIGDVSSAALHGMCTAVDIETANYESLLQLHRVAEEDGDVCLADFVGEHLLREQVIAIDDQTRRTMQLKRLVSDPSTACLGVHRFDAILLSSVD